MVHQDAEELPEAYYKIEENHLKPCAVQADFEVYSFQGRFNDLTPMVSAIVDVGCLRLGNQAKW